MALLMCSELVSLHVNQFPTSESVRRIQDKEPVVACVQVNTINFGGNFIFLKIKIVGVCGENKNLNARLYDRSFAYFWHMLDLIFGLELL